MKSSTARFAIVFLLVASYHVSALMAAQPAHWQPEITFALDTPKQSPTKKLIRNTLEPEILVGQDTYELDPAASGKEFAERLRATGRYTDLPAKPPKVNLALRLTNIGKIPLNVHAGGDDSFLILELRGPGAVNLKLMPPMSQEIRLSGTISLKPGESHEIAITSLSSGMRGITRQSYWTEPGEYTLFVSYNGIEQKPKPVKLNVVASGKLRPPVRVLP